MFAGSPSDGDVDILGSAQHTGGVCSQVGACVRLVLRRTEKTPTNPGSFLWILREVPCLWTVAMGALCILSS